MELYFDDYSFSEKENEVEITYLTFFSFNVPKQDFGFLGNVSLDRHTILFDKLTPERAQKKLGLLFQKYKRSLVYKINKNPVILVDHNLGIPMQGLQFLGILDKGSEMIELKPITNCNMNCTFCSVDEGPDSRKQVDFVVEPQYLIEQFERFISQKPDGKYNVWINPHGEPLLYTPLVRVVKALRQNKKVGDIIIITNGMLLTKQLIDDLADAGLTRFSISFHAMNSEKAKILFGTRAYNVEKVKEMVAYAVTKIKVALTPVYVKGQNEQEMSDIIDWANTVGASVEIQKFCVNKRGRNPVKEQGWDVFFDELKKIQEQTKTQLIKPLGKLQEYAELPKPFKKDDITEVEIVSSGRMVKDKIGVAQNRAVLVLNCSKEKGRIKVKLIQSKYNIFVALPLDAVRR